MSLSKDIDTFVTTGWRLWSYFFLPVLATVIMAMMGCKFVVREYESRLEAARLSGLQAGRVEERQIWHDRLKRECRQYGDPVEMRSIRRFTTQHEIQWKDRD